MALKDFEKLREKLLDNKKWPLKYMFKFIVPNEQGKVDQIKTLLPQAGKLSFKHTESMKYVSITCVANMESADAIIKITDQATQISGVIAL